MKAQAKQKVSPVRAQTSNGVSTEFHADELAEGLNWGKILSWVVVLVPLALWLPKYSFQELWVAPGLFVTLAKIGSLTGTAMMAWSMILTARYKVLDHSFKGLDKMYMLHHLFGALAFVLILWHAFWLTVKFQAASSTGIGQLWLSSHYEVRLGVVALALFIFMLSLTMFLKISYDWFVRIHRWLGVMFMVGALHGFLVKGQMDINPPLFYYMLVLCSFALISFLYHSVFGRLLIKRYRYKVRDVHHLSDGVVEVCLDRRGRPFQFMPGQFGYLSFDTPELSEPHPYSFSSGSKEHIVRFTVKALGDYTTNLMKLQPGTKAFIEGPFGGFSFLRYRHRKQIWIAGGIGITPFLSMARSFKRGYKADLYYCTKNESEAVFAAELATVDARHKGFHLVQICEDRDGFISASTISKVSGGVVDKDFLLCGQPPMMDAIIKQLKELGVPDEHIHMEDFRY